MNEQTNKALHRTATPFLNSRVASFVHLHRLFERQSHFNGGASVAERFR
jgi:hypothetical protein